MLMPDLLLELFSEEIPARMQADAIEHLKRTLTVVLVDQKLLPAGELLYPEIFVTPRRLAIIIKDLPIAQADISTELKGPKVGAPEQALQGFLKKSGLTLEQLEQRDGVYVARIHQKGRPTAEILKEIIEKTLANFPWPKSMRWGSGNITWVRPLHSILCIFDGHIVPVEFAGVRAGTVTYGHRFLSPAPITLTDPAEYEPALKKAHVVADRAARKEIIRAQAEEVAKKLNLSVKPDEGLLEEVTGLVEWPVLLAGRIDKAYMDLPPEVLVSEMRGHQKYFALEYAPQGGGASPERASLREQEASAGGNSKKLADHFLITANMETKDGGKAIIAGNERVLRARLADGRFFWDQDRKKKLEEHAEGLKTVTYHEKLGSVADKVERVTALAEMLTEYVPGADRQKVTRAAQLSKADLVTGMVGEFPELQGVMGRYYALHQGEAAEVADAIRDHYKPLGPNDQVPAHPVSICVALADKLDTLIGMFAIGEKPTGSKDPFALRRAALGVIRIILENEIRLPLKNCFAAVPARMIALRKAHEKLVKKAEASLHDDPKQHKLGKYLMISETAFEDLETAIPANLTEMLYEFFTDRLKVQLKDSGIRHDVISAVVALGEDDLVRIVALARALQSFLATDDGANLLAAYKRAANILSIEEKKDHTTYKAADLDSGKLSQNEEVDLGVKLMEMPSIQDKLRHQEQFTAAMKTLAELRQPVDRFFDKILVNCEDKELRINRLRLLASIRDSMDSIASFALIEG